MPNSVASSGTQACTVATQHTLVTTTGPTGGGLFVLALDAVNLTAGQWLEVEVSRPVVSGGTARVYGGSAVVIPYGYTWAESPVFRMPSGYAYTVKITQQGVAGGRNVPWSWERIDA